MIHRYREAALALGAHGDRGHPSLRAQAAAVKWPKPAPEAVFGRVATCRVGRVCLQLVAAAEKTQTPASWMWNKPSQC